METIYPEIITSLPEADIPFKGIRGWLLQGEYHQVVFMEIEPVGKVAEHSHGAQWGVVVEGEMSLTIGGVTRKYCKGDHYFIPAGVVHSAEFHSKTFAIDYFADRDRYSRRVPK
jgi:quercetin dioxygenase-like cupin family protein